MTMTEQTTGHRQRLPGAVRAAAFAEPAPDPAPEPRPPVLAPEVPAAAEVVPMERWSPPVVGWTPLPPVEAPAQARFYPIGDRTTNGHRWSDRWSTEQANRGHSDSW